MRVLRALLAVAVPLVLAASTAAAPPAEGKKGKKGKKNQTTQGVVVAFTVGADAGALTVEAPGKGKKGAVPAAKAGPKTFKVLPGTQFVIVSGKKSQQQTLPATFKDVSKGGHVTIVHNGDTAVEVRIHASTKGKGKGKKTTAK